MSAAELGHPSPPADDVREAVTESLEDFMQDWYDRWAGPGETWAVRDMAASIVEEWLPKARPYGTVTDRPADEPRVLSIGAEIVSERGRQDAKWGAPHDVADGTGRHFRLGEPFANISFRMMRDAMQRDVDARAERGTSTMATVLLEEVFEALAESDEQALRAELIQVAAVAAKWVQIIDAREVLS